MDNGGVIFLVPKGTCSVILQGWHCCIVESPKVTKWSLTQHYLGRTGCCTQADDGRIQANDPAAMFPMTRLADRHNVAQPEWPIPVPMALKAVRKWRWEESYFGQARARAITKHRRWESAKQKETARRLGCSGCRRKSTASPLHFFSRTSGLGLAQKVLTNSCSLVRPRDGMQVVVRS